MRSSPYATAKTLKLRRGLAVIRYASSEPADPPALVRLGGSHTTKVEHLAEPGSRPWELDRVGQCLVLRVDAPTTVPVQIIPLRATRAPNVAVVVEYLTPRVTEPAQTGPTEQFDSDSTFTGRQASGRPREEPRSERTARPAFTSAAPTLRILGHVSRLGDRIVAGGEWLSGPDRPLPVEGLEVHLDAAGHDLSLFYAASSGGRIRDLRPQGTFVGTRGKARPLRILQLELRGSDADRFVLSAEALFFGAPLVAVEGRSLILHGPAQSEALLGLRFSLRAISSLARNGSEARGKDRPAQRSDVLVFR